MRWRCWHNNRAMFKMYHVTSHRTSEIWGLSSVSLIWTSPQAITLRRRLELPSKHRNVFYFSNFYHHVPWGLRLILISAIISIGFVGIKLLSRNSIQNIDTSRTKNGAHIQVNEDTPWKYPKFFRIFISSLRIWAIRFSKLGSNAYNLRTCRYAVKKVILTPRN